MSRGPTPKRGAGGGAPAAGEGQGEVRVTVTLGEARGLRAGARGSPDPCCTCEVLGKPHTKVQTPVCKGTLNPQWNHETLLSECLPGDRLLFQVFDRSPNARDGGRLGSATLDAAECFATGFDGELPLAEGSASHAMLRVRVSVAQRLLLDHWQRVSGGREAPPQSTLGAAPPAAAVPAASRARPSGQERQDPVNQTTLPGSSPAYSRPVAQDPADVTTLPSSSPVRGRPSTQDRKLAPCPEEELPRREAKESRSPCTGDCLLPLQELPRLLVRVGCAERRLDSVEGCLEALLVLAARHEQHLPTKPRKLPGGKGLWRPRRARARLPTAHAAPSGAAPLAGAAVPSPGSQAAPDPYAAGPPGGQAQEGDAAPRSRSGPGSPGARRRGALGGGPGGAGGAAAAAPSAAGSSPGGPRADARESSASAPAADPAQPRTAASPGPRSRRSTPTGAAAPATEEKAPPKSSGGGRGREGGGGPPLPPRSLRRRPSEARLPANGELCACGEAIELPERAAMAGRSPPDSGASSPPPQPPAAQGPPPSPKVVEEPRPQPLGAAAPLCLCPAVAGAAPERCQGDCGRLERLRALADDVADGGVEGPSGGPEAVARFAELAEHVATINRRRQISFDEREGVAMFAEELRFMPRHYGTDYTDPPTAEFEDPAAAKRVLRDAAELCRVCGASADVLHRPAPTSVAYSAEHAAWLQDLAHSRAACVVAALAELGVPRDRLRARVEEAADGAGGKAQYGSSWIVFHGPDDVNRAGPK